MLTLAAELGSSRHSCLRAKKLQKENKKAKKEPSQQTTI